MAMNCGLRFLSSNRGNQIHLPCSEVMKSAKGFRHRGIKVANSDVQNDNNDS